MQDKNMARKVFISVLGFTNYGQCTYVKDEYKSTSVRFIQEATLGYLCQQMDWTANDVAYILLTDGAEKANWNDDGHKNKDTGEILKCEGLQSRLQKMDLPFDVNTINKLPDGNNEEEIWTIFERVFEELREGDELYFDLTHGFRYLPMLVMVLINYSKFLKSTSVKSITYGNYESRNEDTNEAPIIDLLPLSTLQDWTYAAGQFLESGNVQRLINLCNNELKPILKATAGKDENAATLRDFVNNLQTVIEERQNCRGMNIIGSESLCKLKNIANKLESTIIAPLNPVFNEIKDSLIPFDENKNVENGFYAAVWCFQNNMLQQSATILQEFVISYFCLRHSIRLDDEDRRDLITSAFAIKFNHIQENDWNNTDEEIQLIKIILNDELFTSDKLINLFNNLSEVRNDINHSGMRSKRIPLKSKSIRDNIRKCIEGIGAILLNENIINIC